MKTYNSVLRDCLVMLCVSLISAHSFSQDFNVQHVQDDIGNTGGSNTSFTAVSTLNNAFVLANNNRKVSAGINGNGSTLPADDLSGARVLTGVNTLSYYRQSGSTGSNTRFNGSIWEYTGTPGGPNEMIVRGRYAVSLNGSTNSVTQVISGITNVNKCIPFITGIITNRNSRGADSGTAIAYLENASTLRVEKGTNANTVTVYITVVEFTGSNWTVLHGDSGSSSADTGTITLRANSDGTGSATNVSNWGEAVIFTQHRGDNNQNAVNDAIADNWPTTDPGFNNQSVDWTFHANHDSNGNNRHFVHVLNNSDLNVTRFQNTSNSAGETTINISSAGLSNINQALIVGTSTTSGGGTAYPRGWRNYYLNSTTQAAHWCARSGNVMSHELQIVDLSALNSIVEPEINLVGNSTNISDGDTTPSLTDDTDFGSISTLSTQEVHTFTIQNTGNLILNLGSITIGGSHAADFTVTANPSVTVAASGSTSFDITFDPSAVGLRTATVTIANDDSDESPFNFSIQGAGVTPSYCTAIATDDSFEWIGNVTVNSTSNTSSGGSTSTGYSDFTALTPADLIQGSTGNTISVTPVWLSTLYTEGVSVWIDFNQDYSFDASEIIMQVGPDTVSPQTGTFTIPVGAVLGNTRMRVIMDDAILVTDPCNNPNYGEVEDYTVNIIPASTDPEINITGNSISITDGDITPTFTDNTDFGNVNITGGTNPNTFIIENLGGGVLNLTGSSPYITIGGAHAADFTITSAPSNSIAAYSSSAFVITFDPSALGLRTATVTIANDDSDENPYNFNIQGTGFVPPPCGSSVVHTADFETGLDGWTSGGVNANRVNNTTWSYNGSYSLQIRNGDAVGSTTSFDSPSFDLSNYEKVDFKFFFSPNSMDSAYTGATKDSFEEFTIEYSSDNGVTWAIVQNFESGQIVHKNADFETSTTVIFYGRIVTLKSTDYSFPASAISKFRIRCNGDANDDEVYIDNITINGTSYCSPSEGPGGATSDLDLWLKADMVDGINENADGSAVNSWFDNGKGNHAETMVSGLEPVYRDNTTNNFNFNPVIEFENNNNTANSDMTYIINDGSRDELTGTGGFNSADMYVVIMPDPTITTTMIPLDTFTSSDPTVNDFQAEDVTGFGYGAYSQRFTDEYFGYCLGTSQTGSPPTGFGRGSTSSSINYNQIGIINIRHNSTVTDMELYLNGISIGDITNDAADFSTVTNTKYWLGRSQYWNGSFDGRIAEIITFSSVNNDGDLTQSRNRIQSYLAIKYGITLGVNGTSQDYVDSDGTVIWDESANTGYNYDIAGIGRDDISELNQKQSRSVNDAADGTGRIEGILTIGLGDIYDTNTINKNTNAVTFNDKEFLVWGNNGADLDLASSTINVDMSSGISGVSTPVTFTGMQRIWKFVETGGDVPSVKVRIPQNAIRNITPPGSYLMFISDTNVFDPTADYQVMTSDGSGNLETDYDFDGTKFITFGYAPQVIVERSVYFDGTDDYIDIEDRLDIETTNFTLSAWIKRDGADSGTKSILSKRDASFTQGLDFRILNNNSIEIIWKNGGDQSLISNTRIPDDQWHHVSAIYDGSDISLYIDGVLDNIASRLAPLHTNESFLIAAAGKGTISQFFRGNIDEVRVWDTALTVDQLRYIMNQEIVDNAGQVMGTELPSSITKNDINAIPWSDLAGYYPMSVFTYTNTDDASGNGKQGALRNLDTVDHQTAPLPYASNQNGDWDTNTTWTNGSMLTVPGSASIVDSAVTVDWNIVRTSHNITLDNSSLPAGNQDNRTVLGLYVDANELTVDGDNSLDTGYGLTVSHYLRLEGKIDLEGESQLIQTVDSDLLVVSNGALEKDQQGTADTFTYNYWSAPVGETDLGTNNYRYTVQDIMYDGTNPVNFTNSGYNGSATTPVTIADYWIWKYADNPIGDYSSWQHVRRTGNINAGEGFTMKGPGTGSITTEQNYVFLGKPNNADINLTISAGNNYLVGNPYASAIDADKFIQDNGPTLDYTGTSPETNALLSGTLYFWEHWGGGSHILQEYQGGYATYNFSGGVAAASLGTNDPDVATGGTPTKIPGRYIPVGQGFFVAADNTGTINFNNSQRVFVKEGASSTFVRNDEYTNATESAEIDNRMKLRFGFYSINTIHRQLLLTIDDNATSGIDWGYDASTNDTQMDDMFWRISNENFVIQASNIIEENTIFPLGVITDADGINRISIDALENVPSDLEIFVHDKTLNIYHDLRANDYEIFLNSGEYTERFEITFGQSGESLGIDDEIVESIDILYSNDKEKIVLLNPHKENIKSIELYNILGQSMLTIKHTSEFLRGYSEYEVENLSSGTYIIKLNTAKGAVLTKKVLVK
ncbi:MAG: choice-of-anchor D domain-containing protein [Winogradskyella sp.]|uniref:choice-of-anchor D domain-containing protein n=1 Tax=Winogradskyella sp. TaxID=1883156 RepID=UPI0025F6D66B|nr:choice-of-anchor D domain-containing protein [Winogradskyella sp.]NRB61332.1 choice-of-anchor D domain-containing protein [Winogradskyella sp.]